jgi:hypothetical protein
MITLRLSGTILPEMVLHGSLEMSVHDSAGDGFISIRCSCVCMSLLKVVLHEPH